MLFNSVLLLLLAAQHVVQAQYDPFVNFCRRIDQQSIIIDQTLYVDGGRAEFVTYGENNTQISNRTIGNNQYLISVDVSSSWNWRNADFPQKEIVKPTLDVTKQLPVPDMSRGALYPDPTNPLKFWLFGGSTALDNTSFIGYQMPQPNADSLWSYDSQANTWTSYNTSQYNISKPSSGISAYIQEKGLAFYLNGMQDNGTSVETAVLGNSSRFLDGMIVMDLNNETHPIVRNISTAAVSDMARVRGGMVHVPLNGSDGIMVLLGGGEKLSSDLSHDWFGQLVSFESVDIFDVGSLNNASTPNGTWYRQLTTGPTPDPRIDACFVMMAAPDNSSYNIYMYGGRNGVDTYFDEVWILTLPSFQWLQPYAGSQPRYGMTCHLAGNRQMITAGGSDNSDLLAGCDWHTKGVGVMDLTAITWGPSYNAAAAPYTVPKKIVDIIGGSVSGNASVGVPASGFADPGLQDLFYPPQPNVTMILPSSAPATPSAIPITTPKKSHVGAIAGGVIGGLCFLVLLAGAIIFFIRHKRQSASKFKGQELDGQGIPPKFLDSTPVYEKFAPAEASVSELHDSKSDVGSGASRMGSQKSMTKTYTYTQEEAVELPTSDFSRWEEENGASGKGNAVKDVKRASAVERKPLPVPVQPREDLE